MKPIARNNYITSLIPKNLSARLTKKFFVWGKIEHNTILNNEFRYKTKQKNVSAH